VRTTALIAALLLLTGMVASGPKATYGARFDGLQWSGYVASGGTYTQVGADWMNPPVTCNASSDLYAPWVGIDGSGSRSVEQTGVETSCADGTPEYRAWYEMYPQPPVYYGDQVDAGDSVTASVSTDGQGHYTLTITDDTLGWTETTAANYSGQNASAEAVLESPANAYPDYGQVDFSDFTINNQIASTAHPAAQDASGRSGQISHAGPLAGGSFSVTYDGR
jgi:hypothetical protein